MTLNLNPKGSMAYLYRSFYNEPILPNNLCTYFWKLVMAIILTPIVWPVMIINWIGNPFRYYEDEGKFIGGYGRIQSIYGALFNICIMIVGMGFTEMFYGKNISIHMSFYKVYFNGIVSSILCIAIIGSLIAIVGGLYVLFSKIVDNQSAKNADTHSANSKWLKNQSKKRIRQEKWEKSFIYLCGQYFKAWKEKNCPMITWETKK